MAKEAEELVINTSPLVTLGRAGALEVIGQLPFRFVTPRAVADEIVAGTKRGLPVALPEWVAVEDLRKPVPLLAVQSLDRGEAEVIFLALQIGAERVSIDEWRGRRVASSLGLQVTGSLGLLGRAKSLGIIDAIRPWIVRLTEAGARLDGPLIRAFLAKFDEE